jgi:hypothetical protein
MADEETHLMVERGQRDDDDSSARSNNKNKRGHYSYLSNFRTVNVWKVVSLVGVTATAVYLLVHGRIISSNNNDDDSHIHSSKKEYETAGRPSTQSKYKKVQGIGFQIYTGGAPAFLTSGSSSNNNTKNNEDDTVVNPECVGLSSYGQVVGEYAPKIQCYIGNENAMDDVQKRLEIMTQAVERAYEQVTSASTITSTGHDDDNPETLKIFIAPEFYWRGIDGAYVFQEEAPDDPDVCGPVCHILQGLEGIAAQKRFENWLFVFGSVIASEKLPPVTRKEDKGSQYDMLFYNFAPLYKGYDPAKTSHHGKRFIIPKRYVSSSDFLSPRRHAKNATLFKELLGGASHLASAKRDAEANNANTTKKDSVVFNPFDFNRKRHDYDMWIDYKEELDGLGYAMIEYDWIMMDGLSLSVEICFDHQMRSALNTYLGDIMTGQHTLIPSSSDDGLEYVHIPKYQAQISIVSSAGMTVTTDSLALTNGGTIFLQDGLYNDTNRMFWSSEGLCELGLQFEGGTEAVQRRAFLSPTDIMFKHVALSNLQRVDLYEKGDTDKVEEELKTAFSAKVYPPQLIIFDAVDIAEVTP